MIQNINERGMDSGEYQEFQSIFNQDLKGEFSSQTYGLSMIAKVTEMNRKNFFPHFLFSTSAGGLAGNLVLA